MFMCLEVIWNVTWLNAKRKTREHCHARPFLQICRRTQSFCFLVLFCQFIVDLAFKKTSRTSVQMLNTNPVPVYSTPHHTTHTTHTHTHTRTHTHTHTHLTRNYICSHIYQHFIITIHYYIVFCHLIIHNFSQHNCKLPEDGVETPKHVGVI
jgi:hypothetical protein